MSGNVGSALRCSGGVQAGVRGTGDKPERSTYPTYPGYAPVKARKRQEVCGVSTMEVSTPCQNSTNLAGSPTFAQNGVGSQLSGRMVLSTIAQPNSKDIHPQGHA